MLCMFVCYLEGGSSSSIPIDYVLLTYSRAVDTSSQAYARSTTSNMSRDQCTEPCLESYSLGYVRKYVRRRLRASIDSVSENKPL